MKVVFSFALLYTGSRTGVIEIVVKTKLPVIFMADPRAISASCNKARASEKEQETRSCCVNKMGRGGAMSGTAHIQPVIGPCQTPCRVQPTVLLSIGIKLHFIHFQILGSGSLLDTSIILSMEAKISQDAPGSSLQVRTLCGQAKRFRGHLAISENAVWQPAPATVRADVKA